MEWIAGAAPGIENVAGERIGTEFVRLVAQPGLAYWLQQADSAGVLERFLPEFSLLKGVEQGGYHHLDVWGHTLLVVDDLECILNGPESVFPTSADMVGEYCSNAQRVPRLKLAALFYDPASRSFPLKSDAVAAFARDGAMFGASDTVEKFPLGKGGLEKAELEFRGKNAEHSLVDPRFGYRSVLDELFQGCNEGFIVFGNHHHVDPGVDAEGDPVLRRSAQFVQSCPVRNGKAGKAHFPAKLSLIHI